MASISSLVTAPVASLVDTPVGQARLLVHPSTAGVRRATVVLGHGAGRGADSPDLQVLAARLPRDGIDVVLVEQPWVLAGRRVAAPPRHLDQAWAAVVDALPGLPGGLGGGPVVWGGRSAGARVAARSAVSSGPGAGSRHRPDALLLLAFPLHPPGRPGADRGGELRAPLADGLPVVVVQGERDPFGSPAAVLSAAATPAGPGSAGAVVRSMPRAGHGLAWPASAPLTMAEADDVLVGAALEAVAMGSRARRARGQAQVGRDSRQLGAATGNAPGRAGR